MADYDSDNPDNYDQISSSLAPTCCLKQIKYYTEYLAQMLGTTAECAIEFVFSEEYNLTCVKDLLRETEGLINAQIIWCHADDFLKHGKFLYMLTQCKRQYCQQWEVCICYYSIIYKAIIDDIDTDTTDTDTEGQDEDKEDEEIQGIYLLNYIIKLVKFYV